MDVVAVVTMMPVMTMRHMPVEEAACSGLVDLSAAIALPKPFIVKFLLQCLCGLRAALFEGLLQRRLLPLIPAIRRLLASFLHHLLLLLLFLLLFGNPFLCCLLLMVFLVSFLLLFLIFHALLLLIGFEILRRFCFCGKFCLSLFLLLHPSCLLLPELLAIGLLSFLLLPGEVQKQGVEPDVELDVEAGAPAGVEASVKTGAERGRAVDTRKGRARCRDRHRDRYRNR